MERIKLKYPVVVEGKYDKNTLKQIFEGVIISVNGFGVFNSKEKQLLIRRIGGEGIVILTDPDGGGKVIRSFLKGILPPEKVFNAYVPKLLGKEKRKTSPSREGYLGVEGMSRELLVNALAPFCENGGRVAENESKSKEMLTKVDLFADKLTGYPDSKLRRARLCEYFRLPADMTPNALLEAINLIASKDEYREACTVIFTNKEEYE